MQVETLTESVSDLAALTQVACVAELLARETVTLIEADAFGCGVGVFAYHTSDLAQVTRPFIGLLLLDESIALASLSADEALRLADLIDEATASESGRMTKILAADRPIPACDALGFPHEAEAVSGRTTLAVERLRVEDGYPCAGIGVWYEPGYGLDQPGDDAFEGGFTAFPLDAAVRVCEAIRAAVAASSH
jgi:hypothetical protein